MKTPAAPHPRSSIFRRAAMLLAAALGTGCTLAGHDYARPELKTPTSWDSSTGEAAGGSLKLARWWSVFRDPALDSLMDRAASANLDLRLAESRVREARAQRGVVSAGEWPQAAARGAAQRLRDNTPPAPAGGIVASVFQAGFDAAWEIDVFGGTRRAVEAADATVGAAIEDRRAVLVTLFAEVARNYVDVRGLQLQLAVARENIAAQQETWTITRARFDAGLVGEYDVTRAEAQLAALRALVPSQEAALRRALHRLAVLLGQEPGALVASLSTSAPIPSPPPEVRVGLPSDLLLRRPDVRRAERELAAATARVGVAEADLFPRFSLLGSVGLQSFRFGDFADWSSRTWSGGAGVRWPILDGGRIRSNIRVQNERQEQALALYEKAFLLALEDVENALVSYGKEEVRRRALAEATRANRQSVETAKTLYESGLGDYLQVLDAQRSLYATQAQLAQSEAAVSSDLVALYKALGGGWEDDAALRENPGRGP